MTFWNVSAALKSQLSHQSGLNHRINTVLLGRTVAVRKADGGRNRHCDVINDVPLSLYLTLMTSKVRYGSIFHGCYPIRSENQQGAWDNYLYPNVRYYKIKRKACEMISFKSIWKQSLWNIIYNIKLYVYIYIYIYVMLCCYDASSRWHWMWVNMHSKFMWPTEANDKLTFSSRYLWRL